MPGCAVDGTRTQFACGQITQDWRILLNGRVASGRVDSQGDAVQTYGLRSTRARAAFLCADSMRRPRECGRSGGLWPSTS